LAAVRAAQLKHDKEVADKQNQQKGAQEKAAQWTNQITAFNNLIDQSGDLSDQLQNLNDHLKVGTKATAVYIGKMVMPKKKITDSDNDTAHVNDGATPNILFSYADPDHNFLVDKVLAPGSGVTYDLYNPEEPKEEGEAEPAAEEELDDDGNPIPKPPKEPEEKLPKHMIIPEVVKDNKIHFFRVPRLGSYMAICLEYETCLFEEALEAGVADQLAVNEKNKVLAEEEAAHQQQQIAA